MTQTLLYLSDPGHGWLEVPLAKFPDAKDYGTGYGYLDSANGVVYLEEDCEANLFLADHKAEVKIIARYVDDGPRHLPSLPCSHKHRYCSHKDDK